MPTSTASQAGDDRAAGPAEQPDIPEPAWRTRPPKHAARVPLSREAIVEAALRVLDREGYEALSMRRVAEELELPPPDPRRWQEQGKELLLGLYVGAYAFEESLGLDVIVRGIATFVDPQGAPPEVSSG